MGDNPFDKLKLVQAARDLRAHAETTFAMFLDSRLGWTERANLLLRVKQANMSRLGFSEEKALGVVMSHVIQRKDGTELVLHKSSVAETLDRLGRFGSNHVFLANMCAAWLYSFWDAQGREQMAEAFFGKYDVIQSDLYGDLRHIRNCILHKGIADARVNNCKMIKWFKAGDRIEFNEPRLYVVVAQIRKFTDALEEVANDPSPGIKAGSIYYGPMDAQGKYLGKVPEGMGKPLKDPTPQGS